MSDFWIWAEELVSTAALKGGVKAVILGAIAGATFLLTRVAMRHGEVVLNQEAGHTVQSPKLIVVAGLCGACAVAFLAGGILDPGSLQVPGPCCGIYTRLSCTCDFAHASLVVGRRALHLARCVSQPHDSLVRSRKRGAHMGGPIRGAR